MSYSKNFHDVPSPGRLNPSSLAWIQTLKGTDLNPGSPISPPSTALQTHSDYLPKLILANPCLLEKAPPFPLAQILPIFSSVIQMLSPLKNLS